MYLPAHRVFSINSLYLHCILKTIFVVTWTCIQNNRRQLFVLLIIFSALAFENIIRTVTVHPINNKTENPIPILVILVKSLRTGFFAKILGIFIK